MKQCETTPSKKAAMSVLKPGLMSEIAIRIQKLFLMMIVFSNNNEKTQTHRENRENL